MYADDDTPDESDDPERGIYPRSEPDDPVVDHELVRPWIDAITNLLAARGAKGESNPKVQAALDRYLMTALDRATRVLRSDLRD